MAGLEKQILRNKLKIKRVNGSLRLAFHKKWQIHKIKKAHVVRNKAYLKEHREYFDEAKKFLKESFCGYKDISWHLCNSATNHINDLEYLPEDIFYSIVEQKLNRYQFGRAYGDKNFYDTLFPDVKRPKTIIRAINNRLYDSFYMPIKRNDYLKEILKEYNEVIYKPSIESYGGNQIGVFNPEKAYEVIVKEIESDRESNFVLQDLVKQNSVTAKFHPNSLNTLRIMTLRIGNEIVNPSSVLRIGNCNQRVDNRTLGGMSCGIDENGFLRRDAFTKDLDVLTKHPLTDLKFEGTAVPSYSKAVELCKKSHEKLLHFDIVSWDVAIDDKLEPVLIECNLMGQGLNLHEMANGAIFKDYYKEIIEIVGKCKK